MAGSEGPKFRHFGATTCTTIMFDTALRNYSAAERQQSASKISEGTTSKAKEAETTSQEAIIPGINYNLSACAGKWAYMNDEGGTYVTKGYRIGCEDPHLPSKIFCVPKSLYFPPSSSDVS